MNVSRGKANVRTGARAVFTAELYRDGRLMAEEKPAEPEERVLAGKLGDDGFVVVKLKRKIENG